MGLSIHPQKWPSSSPLITFIMLLVAHSIPQSNWMAERFVQTVKRLLKQSDDLNLALLTYRAMPLPWCNCSPAELLMGRCVRTRLSQTDKQLMPQWPYLDGFCESDQVLKKQQKRDTTVYMTYQIFLTILILGSPQEGSQYKDKYSPQLVLQDLMLWRHQLAMLDGIEVI